MRAWFRTVLAVAREHGCVVTETSSKHFRLTHPDGWSITCSRTPRDAGHAENHLRKDIARVRRIVLNNN